MHFIFSIFSLFFRTNINAQSDRSSFNQKKMIVIPKGTYNTFFISKSRKPIQVASFLMDETAVTNSEYLEFVKANPSWQRSKANKLFVDENYRHKGLGSLLLNKVEAESKALGARLIHLDTFDFQAKDFYLKYGYEIFGVLEECPPGYKRYYMRKYL